MIGSAPTQDTPEQLSGQEKPFDATYANKDGVVRHLGPVLMRLRFENLEYTPKVSPQSCLKWKKKPSESRQILCGISGEVQPGDMVAILGASGAGKSTLLNVLSQRITSYTGQITVNDTLVDKSIPFKTSSCYIQQSEFFFGELTVMQHLTQQAGLRIALPAQKRMQRVLEVIDEFGLNGILDSKIGNIAMGKARGLSGGEKKRLAIATELLTNPSLIFADEPTSGLDSYMAEQIVYSLRNLAKKGHTIVSTIHQPSTNAFKAFNKLMLIVDGRLVFFGPTMSAIPYFASLGYDCPPLSDFASFFIETLALPELSADDRTAKYIEWENHWHRTNKAFLKEWETRIHKSYEDSEADHDLVSAPKESQFVLPRNEKGEIVKPRLSQILWILALRSGIRILEDPIMMRLRYLQIIFMAIVFRWTFLGLTDVDYYSKAGASFFIMMPISFISVMSTITSFQSDKIVVAREVDAKLYSVTYFFITKNLQDILLYLSMAILLFVLIRIANGIFGDFATSMGVLGVILLTSTALMGLGYVIIAGIPSLEVALALGPTVLLPLMMLSGFMIQYSSMASIWKFFYYISPFNYAFSLIMRLLFKNQVFTEVGRDTVYGNQVLKEFDISVEPHVETVDIAILIVWSVVTRLISGILLVYNQSKKQKSS